METREDIIKGVISYVDDEFVDKDPLLAEPTTGSLIEARIKRKLAMMWWVKVRGQQKTILTKQYYPDKHYYMLTGYEIEQMWLTITDQP